MKTPQEKFLRSDFGNDYSLRNNQDELLKNNIVFFKRILKLVGNVSSIAELGCNIGLNLLALQNIRPEFKLTGFEINSQAVKEARRITNANIFESSIINNLISKERFDLTFTKVVLIHINPDKLNKVYDNLVNLSNKYIFICEYYNPSPVTVEYRGHKDRLFKRDFAKELINNYNLNLVDYGFTYHLDPDYRLFDNMNWFLLEKK